MVNKKAKPAVTLAWLQENYPEDATCAFCGEPNDNWDKAGFFYLATLPEMEFDEGKAACRACDEGEPGLKHLRLHGPGNGNR